MFTLFVGLSLFFAIHLLPCVPSARAGLVAKIRAGPYKGVFALASLASFALLVWGFSQAPFVAVYSPPSWGRHAAMLIVPIALVLFAAANMPTHIRSTVKHPMMFGLLLWACAHLLANGDLRAVVVFGSFGIYAVVAGLSAVARGKTLIGSKPPRLAMDAAAVGGGLIVAGLIMHFHGSLFGMPVLY